MGALFVYVSFAVFCTGALFRPVIGILGYILYVTLIPQWLWRFSLSDPQFEFQKYIAVCTLAGYVLSGFRGTTFTPVARRSFIGLSLFLGLSFISALQSIAPDKSWFYMNVIYKEVLMAFLIVKLVESRAALRGAMACIIIGVGWNVYEINADYFRKGFSAVNAEGWGYMNANGLALVFVLAACLSLVAALNCRNILLRWSLFAIGMLNVHGIYILEARGAMLGMLLSAVLIVVFTEKTPANVVILGAAALCAIVLAGPAVVREFTSSFEKKLDWSAESRFYIWDAGLRITADYPLLGVGPWAGEHLVPLYYRDPAGTTRTIIALHNLPLEVSTGSGIPAMIGFCLYFFLPLAASYRYLRSDVHKLDPTARMVMTAVLCGVPGYWVGSLFNSGALNESPYICIALTLAAIAFQDSASRDAAAANEAEYVAEQNVFSGANHAT